MAEAEDDDLTTAVASLRPDLTSRALTRGADPNARLGPLRALHIAALTGSNEIVNLLLNAGADVNSRGDSMDTPLHFACMGGGPNCLRVVRRLIEAGAEINAARIDGTFPLDVAVRKQNKPVARHLVEAGGKCASENKLWVESVAKEGRQLRER